MKKSAKLKKRERWFDSFLEILSGEGGEIVLNYDSERVTIELTNGGGRTIKILPTPGGYFEVFSGNEYLESLTKAEFIDRLSENFDKRFNDWISFDDFRSRNIFSLLIKIKVILNREETAGKWSSVVYK